MCLFLCGVPRFPISADQFLTFVMQVPRSAAFLPLTSLGDRPPTWTRFVGRQSSNKLRVRRYGCTRYTCPPNMPLPPRVIGADRVVMWILGVLTLLLAFFNDTAAQHMSGNIFIKVCTFLILNIDALWSAALLHVLCITRFLRMKLQEYCPLIGVGFFCFYYLVHQYRQYLSVCGQYNSKTSARIIARF